MKDLLLAISDFGANGDLRIALYEAAGKETWDFVVAWHGTGTDTAAHLHLLLDACCGFNAADTATSASKAISVILAAAILFDAAEG